MTLGEQLYHYTTADVFAAEEVVVGKKHGFEHKWAHSQQQEQYSPGEGEKGGYSSVKRALEGPLYSAAVVVENGDEEKTDGKSKN